MEQDESNYQPWEQPNTQQRLEHFLRGESWKSIVDHAENCPDSLELMEQFSIRVASLVFYLEHNIVNRVQQEERELLQLINIYEN